MDASRKVVVRLTPPQRQRLRSLTRTGSAPARTLTHARILLLADADPARPDGAIAAAVGVHPNTVATVRKRFARDGEAAAVQRKPRATPPVAPKVDGRVAAHLIALCCSQAPAGRARWTLRLLAEELTRRGLVTSISLETVRAAVKKTGCSPGGGSRGASPSGTRPGSSPRWSRSSTSMPPRTRPTRR
jgi:transposase